MGMQQSNVMAVNRIVHIFTIQVYRDVRSSDHEEDYQKQELLSFRVCLGFVVVCLFWLRASNRSM